MDSNLQSPRGVSSGFRKQKKGTPFLLYHTPELRVLITGQSASGGRGYKYQAQHTPSLQDANWFHVHLRVKSVFRSLGKPLTLRVLASP